MRNIIIFLFALFVVFTSCNNKSEVSDQEKIHIVEQIIKEYYNDNENVKTINTLMPICELEYWIGISQKRSDFYNKRGKIYPPLQDTIIYFSDHLLMLGLSKHEGFSSVNECTNTLELYSNHLNIIPWEDIKSIKYKGSFQLLSIPFFNDDISKLILFHKRYTRKQEFTVNLFIKDKEGWNLTKSASLIGT